MLSCVVYAGGMYGSSHIIPTLLSALRQFAEALLELIWPTRCVGCEKLGVLLCDNCEKALPHIDPHEACPRCGAPFGRLVCTECTTVYEAQPKDMPFTQTCCALEFNELSRNIIIAYKDGGERRLGALLAHMMAQAMHTEWQQWADLLTWIPADEDAVRRRGFDHMAQIAVGIAQRLNMPIAPLLEKRPHEDQRSLGREGRKLNMQKAFSLYEGAEERMGVAIRNVVLVDDVFTTGATLSAAAQVLLDGGAAEVRVLTMYRVW